MATGHYARIKEGADKTFHLLKGLDPKKDQSYFLHRLTQQQLARILFPLGEQTKKNVYKLAAELGISGVHGAESQDVCFLQDTDVSAFLAQNSTAEKSFGPVITLDGKSASPMQPHTMLSLLILLKMVSWSVKRKTCTIENYRLAK